MPMKDVDKLIVSSNYKKLERLTESKLSPSDLILLVTHIAPVKGKTKMQKQVFLTWKEVFPKKSMDPAYFPWMYGAYSRLIEDQIKSLEKQKFLKVSRRRGEGSVYRITSQGMNRIVEKIVSMKLDISKLKEKKADWDEWTPIGTLRYIYRNYPEYTTKTKVPNIIW